MFEILASTDQLAVIRVCEFWEELATVEATQAKAKRSSRNYVEEASVSLVPLLLDTFTRQDVDPAGEKRACCGLEMGQGYDLGTMQGQIQGRTLSRLCPDKRV